MKAWRGDGPDAIVFHWTGGDTIGSALNTLVKNKLGYHFFIEPDGKIVQGMPINQRAPHAGYSWGPRGDTYTSGGGLNDYAIGISFIYNPIGKDVALTPARKGDIYFWGKVSGGSSIGHQFVTSINAQHSLNLKFWTCGSDWVDKDDIDRTFNYAIKKGLGGFDKNGFRVDGSFGRISYTKEKRNQNMVQYQKDYKQTTTTFSGNDVLGQ